jgi:hypothetical protein
MLTHGVVEDLRIFGKQISQKCKIHFDVTNIRSSRSTETQGRPKNPGQVVAFAFLDKADGYIRTQAGRDRRMVDKTF